MGTINFCFPHNKSKIELYTRINQMIKQHEEYFEREEIVIYYSKGTRYIFHAEHKHYKAHGILKIRKNEILIFFDVPLVGMCYKETIKNFLEKQVKTLLN